MSITDLGSCLFHVSNNGSSTQDNSHKLYARD